MYATDGSESISSPASSSGTEVVVWSGTKTVVGTAIALTGATVVTGVAVVIGTAIVVDAIRCSDASDPEELDPPQADPSSTRINKTVLNGIL
jgi:hypothetical protein